MITFQDIFNAAWEEFIVKDGPPATEKTEYGYSCRYLTKDGRKCAVGLCLPPDLNTKQNNHPDRDVSFDEIINRYPDLFQPTTRQDAWDFQYELHDGYVDSTTGKWKFGKEYRKQQYIEVANKFGLTIPEPA